MSESLVDGFRALKRARQQESQVRRDQATEVFHEARAAAHRGGLELVRQTAVHYQLVPGDSTAWIINLYPGNRRIYREGGAPYLRVARDEGRPWLLRCVEAAVAAKRGR